jgi:hypothetical protein
MSVWEETTMDSTFDIFKVCPGGALRMITTVVGLREAKVRMARLALASPGEYFIYSEEKGVVARQSQNGPTSFDGIPGFPPKSVMLYE